MTVRPVILLVGYKKTAALFYKLLQGRTHKSTAKGMNLPGFNLIEIFSCLLKRLIHRNDSILNMKAAITNRC